MAKFALAVSADVLPISPTGKWREYNHHIAQKTAPPWQRVFEKGLFRQIRYVAYTIRSQQLHHERSIS